MRLDEFDLARYQTLTREARQGFSDEQHRPTYHFTPPANWMNDPNGLIQWDGRYHLFYQHHPAGPYWADMHWGHAVSTDLVHWADLPIALAPIRDGYDRDGVYSGCAVDDNGVPTVIYTSVDGGCQSVSVATGDADLLRWVKDAANPVIPTAPHDLDIITTPNGSVDFRDPYVWHDGEQWQLVIGTGITDVGGAIVRYSSPDLRTWTHHGPILVGDLNATDPVRTGWMWECPQFFPLGDRYVLLMSDIVESGSAYMVVMVGQFDGQTFTPESTRLFDPGSQYASQVFRDQQGRRLLIGWLREQRDRDAQIAAGWSGAMTVPWELSLDDQHRLCLTPVPELEKIRGEHRTVTADLSPDTDLIFSDLSGNRLEFDVVFDAVAPETTEVGLIVRRSPDGAEETRISFDQAQGLLVIDRSQSRSEGLGDGWGQLRYENPLTLDEGDTLRLKVFLDRSVIEVVANGHVMLTARVYPNRDDSLGLGAFARGGAARVSVDAWTMG